MVTRQGLSAGEAAAVERLANLCNEREGLELPLNLARAGAAPAEEATHFLHYEGGKLVGFLSLEGGQQIEACGMVHPKHRRKGIGRGLMLAAGEACKARGVTNFLLVTDEASPSGRVFAEAMGATYLCSEFRMLLDTELAVEPPAGTVRIEPATAANLGAFARVLAASFGDPEEEVRVTFARYMAEPDRHFYLARLGDEPVGTVGTAAEGNRVYVTAFAVLPRYQRRGYGREILTRLLGRLRRESSRQVFIEVETQNRGALSLYRSCGFREVRSYGFYCMTL